MGDLGYYAVCYDCGKEFLCGEHILSYPPIERICFECAQKRDRKRETNEYQYVVNLTEIMRLTHYDKENMKISQNDMVNNKEKILELMKEILKSS
jgi:hypothetical protein